MSAAAHPKAKQYLAANSPQSDLTPLRLGQPRLDIKRYLTDEMAAVNASVEKIIK